MAELKGTGEGQVERPLTAIGWPAMTLERSKRRWREPWKGVPGSQEMSAARIKSQWLERLQEKGQGGAWSPGNQALF